ncbi:hypothetical protein ACFLU6_03645 [Acidobacteriota bacterium]
MRVTWLFFGLTVLLTFALAFEGFFGALGLFFDFFACPLSAVFLVTFLRSGFAFFVFIFCCLVFFGLAFFAFTVFGLVFFAVDFFGLAFLALAFLAFAFRDLAFLEEVVFAIFFFTIYLPP